jgi:hypothetical protein
MMLLLRYSSTHVCGEVQRGEVHTIPLEPVFKPRFRLSFAEDAEVRKQVSDLLAKGFLEPSTSPCGAPVQFVQREDYTMRMCIDFRERSEDHSALPVPSASY